MRKRAPETSPGPERDAQDQRHDSSRRGEHRYPDSQQRPAERVARQERDALKSRLARRKGGKP
jgi:hypothetical protein